MGTNRGNEGFRIKTSLDFINNLTYECLTKLDRILNIINTIQFKSTAYEMIPITFAVLYLLFNYLLLRVFGYFTFNS